jgi:hypothetical protein
MKTNFKTKSILILCTIIGTLSVSNLSIAGGWKDLKNTLKSEKKAIKTHSRVNSKPNKSSKKSSPSSHSGSNPNPELRESILKCDDVALKNVQIGNSTSYKVSEGLSSSNYTGFINRRSAQVSNQCFVGVLQSDECVTMEVSKAELDKITGKDSNNLKMQCVYSDDPSKMATAEVPYKADNVPLNYMLLKCGHDQGDQYACDEGSNSSRSGKYKKGQLNGKVQLSVCGTKYHQVPEGGQHIYCQYYNKKSKKSIFGFEFNQTRK